VMTNVVGIIVKNNEYQVGCGSGGVGCQVTMSGKGVRQ
jgi:precorrin-6B methylase 2